MRVKRTAYSKSEEVSAIEGQEVRSCHCPDRGKCRLASDKYKISREKVARKRVCEAEEEPGECKKIDAGPTSVKENQGQTRGRCQVVFRSLNGKVDWRKTRKLTAAEKG